MLCMNGTVEWKNGKTDKLKYFKDVDGEAIEFQVEGNATIYNIVDIYAKSPSLYAWNGEYDVGGRMRWELMPNIISKISLITEINCQ